jgi:hypothetical protein
VTRFYGLDEANRQLVELRPILAALRDQRSELIRLRDEVVGGDAAGATGDGSGMGSRGDPAARPVQDLRLARLRMQGLIDQMQAGVARLDELDVVLRDIATGLIDFPALVNGRQVWLCWRLGEDQIGWWHELTAGVAGRRRILDLA